MGNDRINFFKVYGVFYACFISFIVLTRNHIGGYDDLLEIAAIVFFPSLIVSFFGIKVIQLIKSIPPKYKILFVLLLALFAYFHDWTYEDCILSHVKGNSGEAAVYVIEKSCYKKYK